MAPIVGILGRNGSGKDEVADYLQRHSTAPNKAEDILPSWGSKRSSKTAGKTSLSPECGHRPTFLSLKGAFCEDLILVHVAVSDPKVRFSRVKKRGEPRDPDRYEDFLDQDRKEEERFHLTRSIEQADVTVFNDGTLEQFHREIERKLAGRL